MADDEKTFPNATGFEVAEEMVDGVAAIGVRGELDLSTAPQLEALIDETLGANPGPLLIDLSECPFIDSTGIAVIVRTWQRLDGKGERRFALCGADNQVRRLLSVTGLDSSVSLHGTRDEGVAALRG